MMYYEISISITVSINDSIYQMVLFENFATS